MKKGNFIIFLISLVVGFYLLNGKFQFLVLPEKILQFNQWILVVVGVIVIFFGIKYFFKKK